MHQMPDFDIDFDVEGRDSVIEHVREMYGSEKFARSRPLVRSKPKLLLSGVARVMDFPFFKKLKDYQVSPQRTQYQSAGCH